MFYVAVHLIDACLAPRQHPKTHVERRRLAWFDPRLRRVRSHYRELEERSRDARYECMVFSDQLVENLRSQELEPLKRHLRRVLRI